MTYKLVQIVFTVLLKINTLCDNIIAALVLN